MIMMDFMSVRLGMGQGLTEGGARSGMTLGRTGSNILMARMGSVGSIVREFIQCYGVSDNIQ